MCEDDDDKDEWKETNPWGNKQNKKSDDKGADDDWESKIPKGDSRMFELRDAARKKYGLPKPDEPTLVCHVRCPNQEIAFQLTETLIARDLALEMSLVPMPLFKEELTPLEMQKWKSMD